MRSEKELNELTYRVKILREQLEYTVNQLEAISNELDDEGQGHILITDVYVKADYDDLLTTEDMPLSEWVQMLKDSVNYVEVKERRDGKSNSTRD